MVRLAVMVVFDLTEIFFDSGLFACCARLGFYIKLYSGDVFINEEYTVRKLMSWAIVVKSFALSVTSSVDTAVPIEVHLDMITNLETTMYLIAANLPPLRPLILRAKNATLESLHKHRWSRRLIDWCIRPRRWLQRLHSAEEESYYEDPYPQGVTHPQAARLDYVPTQQVSSFGEDLRAEVDGVVDRPIR